MSQDRIERLLQSLRERDELIEEARRRRASVPHDFAQHDFKNCTVEDCFECECLVEDGVVGACDNCDQPELLSFGWPIWNQRPDGRLLCQKCAREERRARREAWEAQRASKRSEEEEVNVRHRYVDSLGLFGSEDRDKVDCTHEEITCSLCKTVHNQRPEPPEPDPENEEELRQYYDDWEGDCIRYVDVGSLTICHCCFWAIEKLVLRKINDLIPWYRKLLMAETARLREAHLILAGEPPTQTLQVGPEGVRFSKAGRIAPNPNPGRHVELEEEEGREIPF